MRLFVASFLSADNLECYESVVSGLISDVPDTIRPVPPGTQHLTIVFLGDVQVDDLPTCEEVLESVREIDAVPFTLTPPRILYARRSPRLVCVDLATEKERVFAFQTLLFERLAQRLPTRITRPKPPHITLARFRRRVRREAASQVSESISKRHDSSVIRKDVLTEVQLVRSTLTPDGPIYEGIGRAKLRA